MATGRARTSRRAWPGRIQYGDYYFAGGYSNRDYPALIAAFRNIPAQLLIVCSALNKELDAIDIPPNVTILRDLPGDQFNVDVRDAKGLHHPAGARYRRLGAERDAAADAQPGKPSSPPISAAFAATSSMANRGCS